jgi:hypothetical protein
MRLLAAFDCDDPAAEDVRVPLDLLPRPDEVHVLVVVPHRVLPSPDRATGLAAPGDAPPTPDLDLEERIRSLDAQSVSSIIDRVGEAIGSVTQAVVHGELVRAAATYAADHRCDIIVMHARAVAHQRADLNDVACPILLLSGRRPQRLRSIAVIFDGRDAPLPADRLSVARLEPDGVE